MRAVLGRVRVQRCTDAEGAPEPTQCGSGVAAACGCGERPPCFFTITQLAGRCGLDALPGGGRERQASLITAALGLNAAIPRKGMLGRPHGTKNWPVVGFRLGGEVEGDRVDFDLEHALNQLCGDGEDVRWGYGDGERQQLGAAVARTDPRYEGQVEHDAHAWECYRGAGQYHDEYHDWDEGLDIQCDLDGVEVFGNPILSFWGGDGNGRIATLRGTCHPGLHGPPCARLICILRSLGRALYGSGCGRGPF